MSWIRLANRLNPVWAFLVVTLVLTVLGTLIYGVSPIFGVSAQLVGIALLAFPLSIWGVMRAGFGEDLGLPNEFFRAAVTALAGTLSLLVTLFMSSLILSIVGVILLASACYYWWQTARQVPPFQENQLEGDAS